MIPYYENNAQEFIDRTISIDMVDLYKTFLEAMPAIDGTAHILDAACGSGRDTSYFLSQGYKITAFDSSPALVRHAADLTGHTILEMSFMDMIWVEEFDGIWCSASLLHCRKHAIEDIMVKFIKALKPDGVWYMSFKEGDGEVFELVSNRVFNNYTVESLTELLARFQAIEIINIWPEISIDQRRDEITWVNALVRKRSA